MSNAEHTISAQLWRRTGHATADELLGVVHFVQTSSTNFDGPRPVIHTRDDDWALPCTEISRLVDGIDTTPVRYLVEIDGTGTYCYAHLDRRNLSDDQPTSGSVTIADNEHDGNYCVTWEATPCPKPDQPATDGVLAKILADVASERGYQDVKFGPVRNMKITEWICVLDEEVGEAQEAYLDLMLGVLLNALGAAAGRASEAVHDTEQGRTTAERYGRAAIRKELIQSAAVAVNIIEHMDRGDL